ncbi:MAG: GGDEF domain-containing protein [Oligoflexales bacterium]
MTSRRETTLGNKAAISEMIKGKIVSSPSGERFSVALIDVDWASQISEEIGSEAMDQLMQQFAKFVKGNCRPKDHIALHGGDEFLILLSQTEKEEAFILMEDIRRAISSKTFEMKDKANKVVRKEITCSIGISSFPSDGKDHLTILRGAENAMVAAKKYGRNRVSLATADKMVLKSNYYTTGQLEKLAKIAQRFDVTEAFLLREGLDLVVEKYEKVERG